jgi:DNA-binding LacI/PurR family transcriptional regulator
MAITLKDVAVRAGVSRSAVSRTFTEGASVAAKTRKKVEKAALALGYTPNALASSLTTVIAHPLTLAGPEAGFAG